MKQASSNTLRQAESRSWGFVSNHLHVLACISRHPETTIREIAAAVGISERAATEIVNDLARTGYITRSRIGRRNNYTLHPDKPLRHDLHAHHTIGELLDFLNHGIAPS
jgi:DNA-binding MarR family transcriptional regulator